MTLNDNLSNKLVKIMKLHAHARSCKKIGNTAEAKTYREKADKLAVAWCRRLRQKGQA